MFLLASPAPTDVIVSLYARLLSPAEITREISQQSHPLNGEHIPVKDRYIPIFRRQTYWRNLVSPPRPLSPAETNRCPRQHAFGRLSSDAPKIHRLTSAPCRSSQRKHIRHYAVTRIHFSLRETFLLYQPTKQVDYFVRPSHPTLKSGVFVNVFAARYKVLPAA